MSDILPVTVSDTTIFSERGYAFNSLLGEGSYAKVWLVTYQNTEDRERKEFSLACKIVDSKKAPASFINKFLPREMDVLTKINHPHLIHLHSIYQRKSKFFIFMRFAEKGDLLDHILAHGEVKENQARVWTRQISLGLQYLHQLDIVHRDIKCENVLITANNNVKLADFGFSRFMADSTGKKYLSSTYCGSIAYAAPELLKGKPYDPKSSDIWSLGVVLYVMLNQCMPFNDTDVKKLHELQMKSVWSFRTKIGNYLTDNVKSLVKKMLDPIPVQRIIIDDVVICPWFSTDERLRDMSQREREALDAGIRNKPELLPKSQKLNVPSWKKRKKNEQLVCVTSQRFERTSNQFTFENVAASKPQTERNVPVTLRDAPTTSRDVPTTARDVHTISRDAMITSAPPTSTATSRDGRTISRDALITSAPLITSTAAPITTTTKDPSKELIKSRSKGKFSTDKVANGNRGKTADYESRKASKSILTNGKKKSDEQLQKVPREKIPKESNVDIGRIKPDTEVRKIETTSSGATINVLVKPRVSKTDRLLSVVGLPLTNVSRAGIIPITPGTTQSGAIPIEKPPNLMASVENINKIPGLVKPKTVKTLVELRENLTETPAEDLTELKENPSEADKLSESSDENV